MANTALQVLRTSTTGRIPNTTASYSTNSAYIGPGGLAINMADGIMFSSNGTSGNVFTIGQNSYTYTASNGSVIGFTANSSLVNAAALNVVGQINTATFYATTSANVGANVQLTTSSIIIGNSTVNVTANSSVLSTAAGSGHNFSMLWNVSTSSLDFTYA
jgi:hypothetical protein